MDNSNYIWKDFTKDDLKAWILANTDIQDWNHCHNIELSKEQLASLCNAIGCESISPENIWIYFSDTISPEQWWIGTSDDSEITLTFSDVYKKVKGESLNSNLKRAKTRGVEDNSEDGNTLVMRNIRSISAGMTLKDTYKLTSSEITFLDYVELTNDTISGNSNTSGSKLYWNSYLTKLGKYGIDNKQFKIISYPTNAPVWEDNEGYQFSDKQNYGNNVDTDNSKKYEDWTINNSVADVVIESFSADSAYLAGDISIRSVSDNSFTYRVGGIEYTRGKNSWQDVYLLKRTPINGSATWQSDEPILWNYRSHSLNWYNVSGYGFINIDDSDWSFTGFARCVPAQLQQNPWCNINNCTTEVKYTRNTENTWYDISTNVKIANLFADQNFTEDFYCPEHWVGGYLKWNCGFAPRESDVPNNIYTDGSYYLKARSKGNAGYEKWAVEFHTSSEYTYHVRINGTYKRFLPINESIVKNEAFSPTVVCDSGNVWYDSMGWSKYATSHINAEFLINRFNRGIFYFSDIFVGSVDEDFLPADEWLKTRSITWWTSWRPFDNKWIFSWPKKDLLNVDAGIHMQVIMATNRQTGYAIVLIDRR